MAEILRILLLITRLIYEDLIRLAFPSRESNMRVRPLNIEYRGFQLGSALGPHGFLAAWKHLSDDDWTIGHVYDRYESGIANLGRVCIDYMFEILAKEILLGRDLRIDELPKP